jgi:hypothetical protein
MIFRSTWLCPHPFNQTCTRATEWVRQAYIIPYHLKLRLILLLLHKAATPILNEDACLPIRTLELPFPYSHLHLGLSLFCSAPFQGLKKWIGNFSADGKYFKCFSFGSEATTDLSETFYQYRWQRALPHCQDHSQVSHPKTTAPSCHLDFRCTLTEGKE